MQLFINSRGSLIRRHGERIEVKVASKAHEFSAKKVRSIVIATGVRITSDVIQLACQNKIDIVFLDSSGHPTSRVWQTQMGSTAKIRRRQLEASENGVGLSMSLDWIQKKLENQLSFVGELRQRRNPKSKLQFQSAESAIEKVRAKVKTLTESISDASSNHANIVATTLGLEGAGGRIFFALISDLVPKQYRFGIRSRRPAHDPFNATLNYAYGVLYSEVERAIILAGLDPFIGFFHTDHYNKPSLVFDLIEPFRIVAERTTIFLFTGKRVKQDWFRQIPGGMELSPEGRPFLLESLNKRLDKTIRYASQNTSSKSGPAKKRNIKLRDSIRHEAHGTANRLLGKYDFPQIVSTEDLFGEATQPRNENQ